jgi:hypothetical protein
MSGCAAINVSICSRCTSHFGVRRRVKSGAVLPNSRRSCFTRRTHDSLHLKRVATTRVPSPRSQAAKTSRRISFEYGTMVNLLAQEQEMIHQST